MNGGKKKKPFEKFKVKMLEGIFLDDCKLRERDKSKGNEKMNVA